MKKLISLTLILFVSCSSVPTIKAAERLAGEVPSAFGIKMGEKLENLDVKKQIQPGVHFLNSVPKPHHKFILYGISHSPQTGVAAIKTISDDISTSVYG